MAVMDLPPPRHRYVVSEDLERWIAHVAQVAQSSKADGNALWAMLEQVGSVERKTDGGTATSVEEK